MIDGDDIDENPRPLAVEGRPICKKIDTYERAGDKNCLEPVWKGHWEELQVDIITALALALLFDALLEETTEAGCTTYGPVILEAFRLGCGLKTGLAAPAQSMAHVRWMAIAITSGSVSRPQARTKSESCLQGPSWHFQPHQVHLDVPRCALDVPRCALVYQGAPLMCQGAPWDIKTRPSWQGRALAGRGPGVDLFPSRRTWKPKAHLYGREVYLGRGRGRVHASRLSRPQGRRG
jgi:hypothetical protein